MVADTDGVGLQHFRQQLHVVLLHGTAFFQRRREPGYAAAARCRCGSGGRELQPDAWVLRVTVHLDRLADDVRGVTSRGVFRQALQPEQTMLVRIAGLRALASFLMALEESSQRAPFQELVPMMLQTIADALSMDAEDECRDALEVIARD